MTTPAHFPTPERVPRCDRCREPMHSPGLCGACRRSQAWAAAAKAGAPCVSLFAELEPAPLVRQEELF